MSLVLDAHNITWWVDFGTLLGAVRNGDVLPKDRDIDLGILFEDQRTILELVENKTFARAGIKFTPTRTRFSPNILGYKTFGDIYFWKDDGAALRWVLTANGVELTPDDPDWGDLYYWTWLHRLHNRLFFDFPANWATPVRRIPFQSPSFEYDFLMELPTKRSERVFEIPVPRSPWRRIRRTYPSWALEMTYNPSCWVQSWTDFQDTESYLALPWTYSRKAAKSALDDIDSHRPFSSAHTEEVATLIEREAGAFLASPAESGYLDPYDVIYS